MNTFKKVLTSIVLATGLLGMQVAIAGMDSRTKSAGTSSTTQFAPKSTLASKPEQALRSICQTGSLRKTQKGRNTVDYHCTLPTTKPGIKGLSTKPKPDNGGLDAHVEGSCNQDSNGNIENCNYLCIDDGASNCANFIAWCANAGGDVAGSGNVATCKSN